MLLLPWLWWLGRGQTRRLRCCLALRCLTLLLLIAAAARPRIEDRVDELAVVLLLDVSRSIPEEARNETLAWVQEAMEQRAEEDLAALAIFGDRASLERPFAAPTPADADGILRIGNIESRVDQGHTNIERALLFSAAIFPPGHARRVVLISDGNPTEGDCESALQTLADEGICVDVHPISYSFEQEVIVDGLYAPSHGHLGEPIQLRAVISSLTASDAELELRLNGEALGPRQKIRLEAGTQSFRFSPILNTTGSLRYELVLSCANDGQSANNIGRATVIVDGPSSVLFVSPENAEPHLAQALSAAGLRLVQISPSNLPDHPADYASYGAVVLNGVPAWNFSEEQGSALADAVTHLGTGLIVVGGPNTFGAGGYKGTPIEKLLPVSLEVTHRKVMPKGALVIVLHSIEFDSGNTWAFQICRSALQGLEARDEAGVVYYGRGGEQWLFPLAPLGNGARQSKLVQGVLVGDMPSFHRCFLLAHTALSRSDAAVKHIVVISDGDPQVPAPALLAKLQALQVSVSTILIAPHSRGAKRTMARMASVGNGRRYELDPAKGELKRLPRLMLKEASTLRRAAVIEKPFSAVIALPGHAVLRGMPQLWPKLEGYVLTSPKLGSEVVLLANEEENDPLLALGFAGLGRVAAFTSGASSRWAAAWVSWKDYGPFWARVVRSCLNGTLRGPFPIRCEEDGTTLHVSVDARDEDDRPRGNLAPQGHLISKGSAPRSFRFQQLSPGRYVADLEGVSPGHHIISVDYELDGQKRSAVVGTAVDYAPEHRFLRSNASLLTHAAQATSGRVLSTPKACFRHDLNSVQGSRELWPMLLQLAAILLLLEVGLRRLDFRLKRRTRSPAETEAVESQAKRATPHEPPGAQRDQPRSSEPKGKPTKRETTKAEANTLEQLRRAKDRKAKGREWK